MESKTCIVIPQNVKAGTSHTNGPPSPCLQRLMKPYENQPSLIVAVEALYAYQAWVARVVMPIAFQWIEEHYKEVYKTIDEKNRDDVGVVIAAGFKLVQQTDGYKKGMKAYEKYEEALRDGTLKTEDLNPVWTRITERVRKATEESFEAERKFLDDTI